MNQNNTFQRIKCYSHFNGLLINSLKKYIVLIKWANHTFIFCYFFGFMHSLQYQKTMMRKHDFSIEFQQSNAHYARIPAMPVNFFIVWRYMCKTSSWKFYCDRISRFRDIWEKNPILHLNDFWTKSIWRKMNTDVAGSTQLNEKQEYRMENVRFLALFNWFMNISCVIFVPLSTLYDYMYCCLSLNQYFIEQKGQNLKIICFMNLVK